MEEGGFLLQVKGKKKKEIFMRGPKKGSKTREKRRKKVLFHNWHWNEDFKEEKGEGRKSVPP